MAERSTARILDLQASMDLVVFSVGAAGSRVPSHVYTGGYLDARDLDALAREKVVGDVATVFYRGDGSYDGIALNARSTGPESHAHPQVARRVCVVSGPLKAASVHGALMAGIVTDLILDEALARRLVEGE